MAQKTTKKSQPILWREYKIQDKKITTFAIGDLQLWCKSMNNEIQIAQARDASIGEKPIFSTEPPENVGWARWALKKEHPIIRINPMFPDRPVVVKPESPFKINQGAKAKIYVRIPIWIKIECANRDSTHLLELPSVILSNTWFGTFADGELCYWLSSGMRQQVEPDPDRPYLAICPVVLMNQSETDLFVEKICLRVSNLSMFFNNNQLWSDESKVTYKGEKGASQIDFMDKAPAEAPKARLITSPRIPVKKGFVAQTFASLKDLPGIGILMN
ncbi:MAG TPA: DUF432 domain-containing protein [bacterium]